jgi:hypothetical protein
MTDTLESRWVYRIGGTAAVAGSLLGMVGNLVHPATPMDDKEGVAQTIADSGSWVPIHLAIVFGILLMLGGLFAVRRSIEGGLPEVLASLGLVAGIVGATIGLVLVILDGVAARQLAEEWALASADEQGTALSLIHANETINFALASLFNLVFAAATFILFGLAVALSDLFPRWLGWVAVVAGSLSAVAGTIQAYTGEPTDASRLLTIIGPSIITLWLLLIGVKLLGRAQDVGPRGLEIGSRRAA